MHPVQQVVHESSLWSGGREQSHRFVLSPSVYAIDACKEAQLDLLGKCIEKCLLGLTQMASLALDPQKGKGRSWQKLCAIFLSGVPAPMKEIQLLHPSMIPSICKVDLIESIDGKYYIAEIDGQNKHGLGYSTLAANVREAVMPNTRIYPGVAAQISKVIKASGVASATLIYGDQERFYCPEFEILKTKLASFGIELTVANETSLTPEDVERIIDLSSYPPIFVDFSEMNRNIPLRSCLAEMYSRGKIKFLIPPKPFLGSKAMLAIIRNDEGDEEIEKILCRYIDEDTLKAIRQFIPRTYLVRKKHTRIDWDRLGEGCDYILKRVISSGMKGVHFPDDYNYNETLRAAILTNNVYVMQEVIESATKRFSYFDNGGEVQEADWHMRVTAHYSRSEVADIIVTACRDRRVHGSKECLQIGSCLS